jgi:hypothetical protein
MPPRKEARSTEAKQQPWRQFRIDDTVTVAGLVSRTDWNGRRATVIGTFNIGRSRWPVRMEFDECAVALIKTENLRVERRGPRWRVHADDEGQIAYMMMHAYTKDLNAFAQLTRRQKTIFHRDFEYKMHDGYAAHGVAEFDARLNALKQSVDAISRERVVAAKKEAAAGKDDDKDEFADSAKIADGADDRSVSSTPVTLIDTQLIERTRVEVVDAEKLDRFHVRVAFDLFADEENTKEWVRVAEIRLRDGLVAECAFLYAKVCEKADDPAAETGVDADAGTILDAAKLVKKEHDDALKVSVCETKESADGDAESSTRKVKKSESSASKSTKDSSGAVDDLEDGAKAMKLSDAGFVAVTDESECDVKKSETETR